MNERIGKTMVLGAGAGGIQAALDLAQAGFLVILAEQSDHTGGLISKLDVQFPTSSCGFCRMLPMADRDKGSQHCLRRGLSHENIDLRLSASLISLEGEPGAFTAAFGRTAPLVDPDKCMGCGICEIVCPVEIPDPFNEGLTRRKAVFRPCPQSFANAWTIDPNACTRCGECETACPTMAIRLSPQDRAAFKILVVDDEAIVRDSMKDWLGLEGFGVETANSGKQALERLENTEFQVMLTDIKMPGMDGVELLARAKEIRPEIIVVMMTAYAEVDSAVNAMKEGALDYVTKPFKPDKVIAMVAKLYGAFVEETAEKEEVDAVILATGTGFFVPDQEKNIYGYGRIPGVVTALEFERWLSPEGPRNMAGVERIAWIQCVGSRDRDHGFCSSVCCMISVKQALLAKEHVPRLSMAAVFYMDLRTPGKEFEGYKDRASQNGVRFIRSRIHSLAPVVGKEEGPILVRYVEADGQVFEKEFDMVVLATGQALVAGTQELITGLALETDDWGFVRAPAFAPHETSRPGIYTVGGLSGLKDIETTVTLGAAAAMSAMETMVAAGRLSLKQAAVQEEGMDSREDENEGKREIRTAAPNIHVLVCPCTRFLGNGVDQEALRSRLERDPTVGTVGFADDLCTPEGLETGKAMVSRSGCNRLVIGACHSCITPDQLAGMGLPVHLVKGIDTLGLAGKAGFKEIGPEFTGSLIRQAVQAIAGLKSCNPVLPVPGTSFDRALVVGGGIAGMTAALSIANSGFGVDLVEKSDSLGGNLAWIRQTIEGDETKGLLSGLTAEVNSNDRIVVHLSSRVKETSGLSGRWTTRLEGETDVSRVSHGVVVLATGGREADARETGTGIYTQKAFQTGLDNGEIDPGTLDSLVMIQCRGCRQGDRNYCSRVCCPRALHQAMTLKEKNFDTEVYILYRDMMTPGGLEAFYTRAREDGITFIPYTRERDPQIFSGEGAEICRVVCHDPILDLDMEIEADAVVLAVGVVPVLPSVLAHMFTAQLDEFGFFKAADPKWRPMDALHPRVLGCGLALKPCGLALASATAKAAAARAVGVLSGASQGAVARVRHAYCSLCQICIPACPFNARGLDSETGTIVVDPLACQGCGICAAVCPSKAAQVEGAAHYLDVIDGILAP